jgi:hypothetical protein
MSPSPAQDPSTAPVTRRAATHIAGPIAGMLFAVLFGAAVIIMMNAMTELASDTGDWLETGAQSLRVALTIIPFAGIFFLWFIAVARERLGRFEDQFFSTVFLGSGLLFLALVFAAAASAGALVASYAKDPAGFTSSGIYYYSRMTVSQFFTIYALRMAAVFMLSQATLWMRTGVMPRWMALLSIVIAVVLLFAVSQSLWIVLVFPGWVFMVSAYILAAHLRAPRTT